MRKNIIFYHFLFVVLLSKFTFASFTCPTSGTFYESGAFVETEQRSIVKPTGEDWSGEPQVSSTCDYDSNGDIYRKVFWKYVCNTNQLWLPSNTAWCNGYQKEVHTTLECGEDEELDTSVNPPQCKTVCSDGFIDDGNGNCIPDCGSDIWSPELQACIPHDGCDTYIGQCIYDATTNTSHRWIYDCTNIPIREYVTNGPCSDDYVKCNEAEYDCYGTCIPMGDTCTVPDDNVTANPNSCPEGYEKNILGECVKIPEVIELEPELDENGTEITPECADGYTWNENLGRCLLTTVKPDDLNGSGSFESETDEYGNTGDVNVSGTNVGTLAYNEEVVNADLEKYGAETESMFGDFLGQYTKDFTTLYAITVPTPSSCGGCTNPTYNFSVMDKDFSGDIDVCTPTEQILDYTKPLLWFGFLIGLLFNFFRSSV
jgi:hypothetical protein